MELQRWLLCRGAKCGARSIVWKPLFSDGAEQTLSLLLSSLRWRLHIHEVSAIPPALVMFSSMNFSLSRTAWFPLPVGPRSTLLHAFLSCTGIWKTQTRTNKTSKNIFENKSSGRHYFARRCQLQLRALEFFEIIHRWSVLKFWRDFPDIYCNIKLMFSVVLLCLAKVCRPLANVFIINQNVWLRRRPRSRRNSGLCSCA